MATINLGDDTNINVNLRTDTPINTQLPDINYIPGYEIAEQERRTNEVVRQANEQDRIALYEEMEYKKETDYYKGDKGDPGEKGEKGDPGAIKTQVVQVLPSVGDEDTIYLVPITPDVSGNNYAEYIYINGQWELLGKIGIATDLTDYYTKTQTDTLLNAKANTSDLSTVATSGSYNDLSNKPTNVSTFTNDANYVTSNGNAESTQTNVSSATFNNTLEAPINIDLKGNTSQTGTPTPSSPIPVNVVSGDNEITISDGTKTTTYNIDLPVENLFDKDNVNVFTGYIDATRQKIMTPSPANPKIAYIECQPNTTYTISKSIGYSLNIATSIDIPAINTSVGQINTNIANTKTITTSATAKYLVLWFYFNADVSTYTYQEIMKTIQVEQGTKANSYTPYGTTPIELCKIGTYQDYIYKENDKWYLHKETNKLVLNGSETYETAGTNTSGKYKIRYNGVSNLIKKPIDANTKGDVVSNQFIVLSANDTYRCNQGISVETNGKISFYDDTIIQSTSAFTNWVTTHNIIVDYVLETPTNTEITYQPLIDQLESIKNAMSKEGTTNVNQVNNDAPFMLDLSVFNDTYNGRYQSVLEMYKRLKEAE